MTSPNLKFSSKKAFVEELIRGRELASQLAALIQEKSPRVGDLVEGVIGSLSRALVLMDAKKIENSQGIRKVQLTHRGGSRRRRSHPYSCTKIIAQTIDDGHLWRKYGQKAIYNAKFPRSYFRCTHKFDQNCEATRQVQQSEEDPSFFVITYIGEHTCTGYAQVKSSFNIQEDHRTIDFSSNTEANCIDQQQQQQQQQQSFSLSKQECDEEVVSNNLTLGCSISAEYKDFQELGTLETDGTSGLMQASTSNLGWDFFIEDTFEFNDFFDVMLR